MFNSKGLTVLAMVMFFAFMATTTVFAGDNCAHSQKAQAEKSNDKCLDKSTSPSTEKVNAEKASGCCAGHKSSSGDSKAKMDCPPSPNCPPSKCATKDKADATIQSDNSLTTAQLDEMIKSDKSAIIVDARSKKFDDGTRIPGAICLTADASADDIAKIIPAKDALIVTYCAGLTCPASANLAKHLSNLGYTNVKQYPEGISGWVAAGLKVDKTNVN